MSHLSNLPSATAYQLIRKVLGNERFPTQLKIIDQSIANITAINRKKPIYQKGEMVTAHLKYLTYQAGLPKLLRHADRSAMNFSIENRVPFLTRDLSEYCMNLPDRYFYHSEKITKQILKDAVGHLLPEKVLNRTDKIGFEATNYDQLKNITDEVINFYEDGKCEILNNVECVRSLKKFSVGELKYQPYLFRLMSYAIWHKNMFK